MSQASVGRSVEEEVLQRLQEQTGDEDGELVQELVTVFLEDARTSCARLCTLAEAGPSEDLSREAHRLKSGAANLGAVPMTALCKALEEQGASAPAPALCELADRLKSELNLVEAGLSAYLAQLDPPRQVG